MEYLCKLVTPKNGIVLDPFMGSGTTEIAAKLNNFSFIGIEQDKHYFEITEARIKAYSPIISKSQTLTRTKYSPPTNTDNKLKPLF